MKSSIRTFFPRLFSLSTVAKRTTWLFAWLLLLGSITLAAFLNPIFYKSYSAESRGDISAFSHTAQSAGGSRTELQKLLSLQPEANHLRQQIGKRFLFGGREISAMTGALTIKETPHSVKIIRTQNKDGESLTILIDGNPESLTWSDKDGAKVGNQLAAGEQRALIERIAFDSPDQFILAQARGAIYETMAQQVRPSLATGGSSYTGPVWDLVRIVEPSNSVNNKPLSPWRLYYINASTGLIEKVISQEGNQKIISEISGWVDQEGEKFPTRFAWKLNNQTMLSLSLNSVTFSPVQ